MAEAPEENNHDCVLSFLQNDIKTEFAYDSEVGEYMKKYKIQSLLEYFLTMCNIEAPESPYEYISYLADVLLQAKNKQIPISSVPRALEDVHFAAIFRILDKEGRGYVSFNQYQKTMGYIGSKDFNESPQGAEFDQITKEIFVEECVNAMNNCIISMIDRQ